MPIKMDETLSNLFAKLSSSPVDSLFTQRLNEMKVHLKNLNGDLVYPLNCVREGNMMSFPYQDGWVNKVFSHFFICVYFISSFCH